MTRWFVGQRVKLVRGRDLISPAVHYGLVGTIFGFEEASIGDISIDGSALTMDTDCLVEWDGEGWPSHQHTGQLEPVKQIPCEAEFKESLDLMCQRTEEVLP